MVGRDLNEKFPHFEHGVQEMPGNFNIDALSVFIDMMDPSKSLKKAESSVQKEINSVQR